jgi:hypothetical protein
MDTRKIQSVSGGTDTVSLPKARADEQDLDAETAGQVLVDRDRIRRELPMVARPVADSPSMRDASMWDVRIAPAVERIQRTAEHGGNIAELALQSATRRGELTAPVREPVTGDGIEEDHVSADDDASLLGP